MTTESHEKCTACGAVLPVDAPQGLCPMCLLKAGLRSGPFHNFTPPTPEELGKHFPQLEILGLLGRGGMGVVYKARQRNLDRLVALKILPGDTQGDPAFAERFSREAKALAKLSHRNIVSIHDFGESEGLFYFLMEYVDGVNLRQSMRAKKITPAEALAIVPQVCDALQYAHDKGIVHRDIKPENILLDKDGCAKIADFGLAKILTSGGIDDVSLTQAGQVMGTTHYMAPEQVERPLEVDHRADIYSLGVVFYQMLTGEMPIGRFAAPSRKVQIDVRLDEIVLKTLENEPELRYPQADELKTDISHVVATPGRESPPPMPKAAQSAAPPKAKRSRWRWAALCLAPILGYLLGGTVTPPRQYRAQTTVEIKAPFYGQGQTRADLQNLITREEILTPVLASLQLQQRWNLQDEGAALAKLREELSLDEVQGTALWQIAALDRDPKLATDIVNKVVDEFKKWLEAKAEEFDAESVAKLQNEFNEQQAKTDVLTVKLSRIADGISAPAPPGISTADLDKRTHELQAAYKETIANLKQATGLLEEMRRKVAEKTLQTSLPSHVMVLWKPADSATSAGSSLPPISILGAMVGLMAGVALVTFGGDFGVLVLVLALAIAGLWSWQSWKQRRTALAVETEARFMPHRISVGGDVKTPQLIPYSEDLTVLRVINAAGGFTEYADKHKVRLLRDGKLNIVDVSAILKQPNLDVPLRPGDSIEVPQSFW